MRRRARVLAVVLAGAAGLYGCDAPSGEGIGLTEPHLQMAKGRNGKGGNKKSDDTTIEGTAGMETPGAQPAVVERDNKRALNLRAEPVEPKMSLAATVTAGTDPCVFHGPNSGAPSNDAEGLLSQFRDADFLPRDYLNLAVDRTALPGSDEWGHNLVAFWTNDGHTYRGGIGSAPEDFPGMDLVATAVDNGDGTTTDTFTGGVAGIRDETGSPGENVTLHCPNLDTVVFTVAS